MRASDLNNQIDPEKLKRIQEFVKFCFKKLNLKKIPKIKLTTKNDTTALGYFVPDINTIVVVEKGRHQMDIMRTLAHELVHLKQTETHTPDGSTGSDDENQANAAAGVLLRVWGKLHPEYFVEDRKFTDLEVAIMEGGGSIEDNRTYAIRKQLEMAWKEKKMRVNEIIESSTQLSELFQKAAPWEWINHLGPNDDAVSATFKIEDLRYIWFAEQDPDNRGTWMIAFEEETHGYHISGRGNAAKVFSTVIDITDSFIRKSGANTIVFSAQEPSRKKLYLSLIRRLLPNWKLTKSGDLFTVESPYKGTASDYFSKTVDESATAGATSTANIGTVVNPHISPGKARGKKSYLGDPWGGKSGTKSPPQPKVVQPKNPDGTAKGAHDIKGASLFGGPAVKR